MSAAEPAFHRLRILVVDDEPLVLRALADTLRDEGYFVEGSSDVRQALDLLRGGGFDLLMTDLMMPEMDGITLLHHALQIDPDLGGIVMTGQGSIPSAVQAMKTGAVDYVQKPLKLDVAIAALERAGQVRQLRRRTRELEGRVRLRTHELEAANKELEAFAYSVSHDLRTPLRAVSGLAEVLRRRLEAGADAEGIRTLDLIQRGAREMEELIDRILAFSRLGHAALRPEEFDLAALAREVFADLADECRGRQVEFVAAQLPPVIGDPGLLRHVLMNLLGNAVKFTRPRRDARIELGELATGTDGLRRLFIRDNGVGFSADGASRLFGVFQRLHHPQEFEGSGVGLALVRRIIEQHHGTVWAEGAEGAGATFFFTLPAGR